MQRVEKQKSGCIGFVECVMPTPVLQLMCGMLQVIVYNEGEVAQGCPINIRVTPEISKISFPGMDPCAIGSIVEVLVSLMALILHPVVQVISSDKIAIFSFGVISVLIQ